MKLCFVISHSPYSSSLSRDALDMALASAAFDQQVSLVFVGDGVFHLLAGQQSHCIEQKSLEKSLAALELYDINDCYVCQQSLNERGISAMLELSNLKNLNPSEISQVLQQADQVMSF
jgi:tRNA 2-thiouridine synthesizing protein C